MSGDNEVLLSCPFCGHGMSQVDTAFDDTSQRWRVWCGRCGSSSGTSPRKEGSKEAAIKHWNTRDGIQLSTDASSSRSPSLHREPLLNNSSDTTLSTEGMREALEWVRSEIFGLCEHTEEKYADKTLDAETVSSAFNRGRCFEAKGIRNAMGEVIRERLAALSALPVQAGKTNPHGAVDE